MNNKKKIIITVLTAILTVGLAVAAVVLIGGSESNGNSNNKGEVATKDKEEKETLSESQVAEVITDEKDKDEVTTKKPDTEELSTEEETTDNENILSNSSEDSNSDSLEGTSDDEEQIEEIPSVLEVSDKTYKDIYWEIVEMYEKNYTYGRATYSLIYFNDDDIPELVTSVNGYRVSMFTYCDGFVYKVIDDWPYGAMGNAGYEYIPKKNVIRNYNADMAGAIMYETYERMNDKCEIELYHGDYLKIKYFDDLDNDENPDDEEKIGIDYVHYFFGDKEIIKEEYDKYVIEGDYEYMEGSLKSYEIKYELLNFGLISINDYACKRAYIKQIEEFCNNAEDRSTSFSLIDFDGKGNPELVCQYGGCDISMYTFANGKLYTLLEEWSYGGGGNYGYDFVAGKNVLRNFDADEAGRIMNESYIKVNENYELEEYYGESLVTEYIMNEEGEYEPHYFIGEMEITKEKYEECVIDGDYRMIKGVYEKDEMLEYME